MYLQTAQSKRRQFFRSIKAQKSNIVSAGEYEARILVNAMLREFNVTFYEFNFGAANRWKLSGEFVFQDILTDTVWFNAYKNEHELDLFEREFRERMSYVLNFISYHTGMCFAYFIEAELSPRNFNTIKIEFRRVG